MKSVSYFEGRTEITNGYKKVITKTYEPKKWKEVGINSSLQMKLVNRR
jgi:hypothetical protein